MFFMKSTEDIISKPPILNEEELGGFYADGGFESAVLSDINKEADKIDAHVGRLTLFSL